MSQFRSEEMSLVQLFIQSDAAQDTLHELGEIGCIQFKDLNTEKSAFQRIFVQDVRKCDDMLRILRYIGDLTEKEKPPVSNRVITPSMPLHDLHERLQELEKEMKSMSQNYIQLVKNEAELKEHKVVVRKGSEWFQQASRGVSFTAPSDADDSVRVEMRSLLDDSEAAIAQKAPSMLGHIAGCIPTVNMKDFGLTLFRATRGNMLLRHDEISDNAMTDPKTGEAVKKSVFIVFFSGERSRAKVEKIADSYGGTKYRLPDTTVQQEQLLRDIDERLSDLRVVLGKTRDFRASKLAQVSGNIEGWADYVKREKAVFHTLNMFNYDVTHKCLIAEGWCPTAQMSEVREALRRGTVKSGASVQTVLNQVKTKETPPTHFKTTKLTAGFQAIVDAYGMAKYQEFNPAVFTVITFPFLFGVMFGDIGHGIMMALAGGLMCLYEQRLAAAANDEMFGTLYHGRYNIFLMGIFAIYSGFIYNELFSVPQEFFGSSVWCGSDNPHDEQCQHIPGIDVNASSQKWLRTNINDAYDFATQTTKDKEVVWNVYPFGTDPGFAHTANKLNSVNSFKMKFAIVCGVTQMVAGICCKLMNALHFRDMLTLYFVWIPEIVFINSIFGYLVMLILIKWTTNWDTTFVLNNAEIVSIPQRYCNDELSNVPCWTAPFQENRAALPGYGSQLAALPDHMWCMHPGAPTAGCAVFRWKDRLIVEGNGYVNKTIMDHKAFSAQTCQAGINGCVLWKQSPPSLLDSLIKMFMEIGSVPVENQIIAGQGGLQAFLILIAFISVPMLLLPKPLLLKRQHEARMQRQLHHQLDEEEDAGHGGGHGGHGDHFEFGEVMVHQMIHTIEYVLGCISNTASYLRLWALSLAHAQLSEVFWEKTVVDIGLAGGSPVMIFVTVSAWACFTVGVLMGMESLSAFLHALRLHWVEFMNKFYEGDGYRFIPFDFSKMDSIDID